MSSPVISVCIPAYHRTFLKEAVESAATQDIDGLEIVVTDNGPDDIGKWLRPSNPKVLFRYVKNDENIGMCANFRKALSLARGTYVTFLCGDDLLYPGALTQLVGELESHPDAKLAFSQVSFVGDRQGGTRHRLPAAMTGSYFVRRSLSEARNFVHLCTGTFRRETGQAIPIEDLLFFDWVFWLRFGLKGEVRFIDRQLGGHRYHNDNETRNVVSSTISEYENLRNAIARFGQEEPTVLTSGALSNLIGKAQRKLYLRYLYFCYRQSEFSRQSFSDTLHCFEAFKVSNATRLLGYGVPIYAFCLHSISLVRRSIRSLSCGS